MAAIVIVAGVAFGGETGFLVGAMTMFGSNMLFGQGPWTPWQMFAMGLIGFLAGVLFRKGVLRRSRFALCVYAALTIIIIYGGLMNPASVLMSQNDPTLPMFFTAYLTGFPVDMMHAAATVFFLWVLSQPLLEKLDQMCIRDRPDPSADGAGGRPRRVLQRLAAPQRRGGCDDRQGEKCDLHHRRDARASGGGFSGASGYRFSGYRAVYAPD